MNNKITIGGFAIPAPGSIEAVFDGWDENDQPGDITAPVLALFLKIEETPHGQVLTLDGFSSFGQGDSSDLFPVSEYHGFKGFKFCKDAASE